MAVLIPSIGTAGTGSAGTRLLPIATGGIHGKGLGFAGMLSGNMQQLLGDDPLISQLAALLQQGIPMQSIAERVVEQFSGNARSTLQRGLASALAPPGA